MKHIDIFSGIGGFSLAFDNIFHEQKNEHIFCEIDPFCQAVLKKHWPESTIISDIRTLAHASSNDADGDARKLPQPNEQESKARQDEWSAESRRTDCFLLTGGFPCQPFSQAGRRKGTDDDRHLWPYMLSVIKSFQPEWVIAENVRGILTIEHGMVFEQVCLDLEAAGYEVQPFVIPAVAVNAPHRRDRVWFVANRNIGTSRPRNVTKSGKEKQSQLGSKDSNDATNSESEGHKGHRGQPERIESSQSKRARDSWERSWLEVATELCRVDDGLPRRLDRNPRLKALGNAIVPQVAEEIMQAIKLSALSSLTKNQ